MCRGVCDRRDENQEESPRALCCFLFHRGCSILVAVGNPQLT